MRGIRLHIDSLLGEHKVIFFICWSVYLYFLTLWSIIQTELSAMNLALAHSLGRYKVKFNPEKIDTMIVQVC